MTRMFMLCLYAILISLVGVSGIKVIVVLMVNFFHGGHHQWGWRDAKDVFLQALLLGGFFCVVVVVLYIRSRTRR